MIESVLDPRGDPADGKADYGLRPVRLDEFVGQEAVVSNLRVYLEAARRRGEALDHVLFSGLPGLGKTTLAHLVASELGAEIRVTSGPAVERAGDLAGILTNLKRGDVLFIDEIHRLNAPVEEVLYAAMEDFVLDIVIDQGPSARTLRIDLPPFTLVGATTREGLLTPPLRSRFGIHERLTPYPPDEIEKIVLRSARLLLVEVSPDGARVLADRARGTPRVANRFLRRIRDLACVRGKKEIDCKTALEGLRMLGVDENGLGRLDREILDAIIRHDGGPVGLKTIATIVGEEADTIEDVYEPYLIQKAYVRKTPRGRYASDAAYRVMGRDAPVAGQRALWESTVSG